MFSEHLPDEAMYYSSTPNAWNSRSLLPPDIHGDPASYSQDFASSAGPTAFSTHVAALSPGQHGTIGPQLPPFSAPQTTTALQGQFFLTQDIAGSTLENLAEFVPYSELQESQGPFPYQPLENMNLQRTLNLSSLPFTVPEAERFDQSNGFLSPLTHSGLSQSFNTGYLSNTTLRKLRSAIDEEENAKPFGNEGSLMAELLEKDRMIADLQSQLAQTEVEKAEALSRVDLLQELVKRYRMIEDLQSKFGARMVAGREGKARKSPGEAARGQTAIVRQKVVCIKCRRDKKRCEDAPFDPHGRCKSCVPTGIPHIPCIRTRVTEASLFRTNTSEKDTWSIREEIYKVIDLTTLKGQAATEIELTQGFGPTLSLQVQEFEPVKGDETSYRYNKDGVGHERMMPQFALANVAYAFRRIEQYLESDDTLTAYVKNYVGRASSVVQKTFEISIKKARLQENIFIKETLSLWLATRLIEKPWRICGKETLGMNPNDTPESPWEGAIPISPVMDTQFDQIIINLILNPLRNRVLERLQQRITARCGQKDWFDVFLVVFILLNSIEIATAHDHEFANFYGHVTPGKGTRFEDYNLIERYFHSAQTLIANVRDTYNGLLPIVTENVASLPLAKDGDEVVYLDFLRAEAFNMQKSVVCLKSEHKYESLLYWCHQLFYQDWEPFQVHIREID